MAAEKCCLQIRALIFCLLYVVSSWQMFLRKQRLHITSKISDGLYVIARKNTFTKGRCQQINSSFSFRLYVSSCFSSLFVIRNYLSKNTKSTCTQKSMKNWKLSSSLKFMNTFWLTTRHPVFKIIFCLRQYVTVAGLFCKRAS